MIGQTLGHYRILEKIGAGGMGVVYRAHDGQLDRDIALKVLPPGALADDAARQRFRQEALALSRLNHPHICTIYEIGEAEGQTYIAMEFVEGRQLSALVRGEGLPVETAARYGAQIADALAHAHERGVIHRDLKSANVIITPDGRAKVLDFGLAKRAVEREAEATRTAGLTEAGTVVGTLHYMAPEVLRGGAADARSDVWALGVMLYEMAAGQLPFQGKTGFDVSSAVLRDSPAPLPAQAGPGLRAIVQRCLAKEPGERYQRAGEVRAALEATQSSTATIPVVPAARLRSRWWIGAAAGVTVLATVGLIVFRDRLKGTGGGARLESLAVLPLDNLSHDPEQDYFADGMTEQLITDLSKIASLRVISRTSVMQYKGTKKPLPEIAKALHVDAVVEGSVLRSGNRVRITAQLIQAADDKHLWAESYDRDLRDVLALQSEVAKAIAAQIQATITPQERQRLAGARKVDPEAHQLYLKGRFQASKGSEETLHRSIEYFDQVIAKDPRYALAYAGKAFSYFNLSSIYLAPREVMPKAKAAAEKAIELDDSLAEAHISLGNVKFLYDWDWAAAEKEFKRALELNPSSSDAHGALAWYLTAMGRTEEAIAEYRRAQELDPLSLIGAVNGQWMLFMARKYDEVIAEGRRTLDMEPNFAFALWNNGLAYAMKQQYPEAIAALEKGTKLDDSPLIVASLAWGYGMAGKRREAEKTIENLKAIAQRRYVCSYEVAAAFLPLGKKEQVFQWFERSMNDRSDCMVWLNVDPRLDSLRPDPRFQDLLRRAGHVARPAAQLRRAPPGLEAEQRARPLRLSPSAERAFFIPGPAGSRCWLC